MTSARILLIALAMFVSAIGIASVFGVEAMWFAIVVLPGIWAAWKLTIKMNGDDSASDGRSMALAVKASIVCAIAIGSLIALSPAQLHPAVEGVLKLLVALQIASLWWWFLLPSSRYVCLALGAGVGFAWAQMFSGHYGPKTVGPSLTFILASVAGGALAKSFATVYYKNIFQAAFAAIVLVCFTLVSIFSHFAG